MKVDDDDNDDNKAEQCTWLTTHSPRLQSTFASAGNHMQ
jgi:inhibitor of KinA sporulation pathway (predicted exonuclease)